MKLFEQYRGLRRELYILFIGRMMTNMGSMIWPMFTLILSKKLGMSAGTIASYMLIFSIVALPMNLIGGRLADKYSKKNIIVVCDIISIASYIYCSLVEINFRAIVVFAAASLFQTIEWPSYDALVADFTVGADRERAYSLSYLGANLGLVLSPSIGGLLFNEHLNLAFLINGISIALSTFLIAFFIRDTHRETDESAAGIYEKDIESGASSLKYILSHRVIWIYILASMFANTVYEMWNYLMPLDMGIVHGDRGAVLYGTMTSLNCIEVVLFTALMTRLFRKVRDTGKMVLGETLILSGFVFFMFFTKNIFFCYLSIFVFTLGEILNTLASSPFLTRRIPASHRGRIMSVMGVSVSMGGALLRNLVGSVYDKSGSRIAWALVLALGLGEIMMIFIMRKHDREEYKELYAEVTKESDL
ncbi:MAG: MFS transporter [Firmicutes bacterium]|nr:MFS transporter [Bacillota bacterium]